MTLYDALKARHEDDLQHPALERAGVKLWAADSNFEATLALRSKEPEAYSDLLRRNPGLGLQLALYEQGRRAAGAAADTKERGDQ